MILSKNCFSLVVGEPRLAAARLIAGPWYCDAGDKTANATLMGPAIGGKKSGSSSSSASDRDMDVGGIAGWKCRGLWGSLSDFAAMLRLIGKIR
jgi:hypothetical protein